MKTDFELAQGRNRALVCYCSADAAPSDVEDVIEDVLESLNIEFDPLTEETADEEGRAVPHVTEYVFETPKTSLNIALCYGDGAKRLKVGGTFSDVCVGVFFYNEPDPPEPEIIGIPTDEEGNVVGEPVYEDVEPEPEPPSIPQLVCEALASAFEDGKAGASAFVISPDMSEFELEVE